ncbi:MAG: hypothetical protein ACRDHU_06360 [Actinomycetota bacterium]
MKSRRPPELIEGFSRSLWVSLAVKSIRFGWPAGFAKAMDVLRFPDRMRRDLILAGTFEDLWPSRDQLPAILDRLDAGDLDELMALDTHHGRRQLSMLYAELAPGVERDLWKIPGMAKRYGNEARSLGIGWLGRRALAEFAIWLEADPPRAGRRELDLMPWRGMPPATADLHTSEGRRAGTMITLLCGHPKGHLGLMRTVAAEGWLGVRARVHSEPVLAP